MVHLLPLPGSPGFGGRVSDVLDAARRDAAGLAAGGVHGVMVENFGDVPFFPGRVPAEVVAHTTAAVAVLQRELPPALPVGVNVLRNDGLSALAVAHATGASFIRVNVLCGARVTDQGVVQGIAHDLLRLRAALRAEHIAIFADVDVKHSAPLSGRPLQIEDEVDDTLRRGLADALIVSGAGTGKVTDADHVRRVQAAARDAMVFVGSGATATNIARYRDTAAGFIVGTAFKGDGLATNPVDAERVRELMAALT